MGLHLLSTLLGILFVLSITQEGSATCICPSNGCSQSPSTGSCHVITIVTVQYQYTYTTLEYYTEVYYVSCSWWSRCKRERQRSRVVERQAYAEREESRCSLQCCSGYQMVGSTCVPQCHPSCANGGTCVSPNTCSCQSGWTGPTCNQPYCSSPCENGGLCAAPFTCTCTPGWSGSSCADDIDECSDGPCSQDCINTPGSFYCGCGTGYLLHQDGINCTDVDECLTFPCDQICINTPGSFLCDCYTGFHKNESGGCTDNDECKEPTPPCLQICINTLGSFICDCWDGYELINATHCNDTNECARSPCSQICHNTPGSYMCSCEAGYILIDETHCQDVNECIDNTHSCSQNCQNRIGGYFCYCNKSYILNANGLDCDEFQLISSTLPPVPMDTNFISIIEDFESCADGNFCYCMHEIFRRLNNSGFSQTVNTEQDVFWINISPDQPVPISDLILAVFRQDAQNVLLPYTANLLKLAYNCTSQELYAETSRAGGTLNLFQDFLTISYLTLKVNVSNIQESPMVNYLELSGFWTLGGAQFYMWLNVTTSQWHIGGQLVLDEDIDFIQLLASVASINVLNGPFGNLIFLSDISIQGLYDTQNQNIVLVLQGTVRIRDWFQHTVCIFLHYELADVGRLPPEFAFVTGCDDHSLDLELGNFIQGVTGFAIAGISFLDNLNLPNLHIVYHSPNFHFPTLGKLGFSIPNLALAFNQDHSGSGFKVVFDFNIEDILQPWLFQFGNGKVTFQPLAIGNGFRIGDILGALSNLLRIPSIDLFDLDLFDIQVVQMDLDLELRTLHLSIEVPLSLTIFLDELQLQHIGIDFEVNFRASLDLSHFNISGLFNIAGSLFSVQIQLQDGSYQLQACAPSVDSGVSGVASGLQSPIRKPLLIQVTGLADIGIRLPCFSLTFRASQFPENMCFSANILRSNFGDVTISACVSRSQQWIYAFEIQKLVLARLLTHVVGNRARSVAILNQQLDIAVVVAPSFSPKLPLRGELVSGLKTIAAGTTIVARSSWPNTCSSDRFCVVARDLLGEDARMFLKIEIRDSGTLAVEAEVRDFQLSFLTLTSASLQIRISPSTFSLGIQASLDLSTPPVTLTGALRLKLPTFSVALEMSMSGCWNNAFGIPIVDLCNLYLAVTVTPGVPVLGIAFGGRVRVGSSCYQLEAAGYIGLGSPVPEDNFFYAEMGPLTLQNLLEMFCISFTLPSFLGDTGFPDGFVTSFALTEISIPTVSLTIPRGFYFRGTLNIFGFQIFSEIILDPPRLIDIYARLRPLHLAGGLLAMYESRDVRSRGPYLQVYIELPVVRAEASGYVRLFGIEAEAKLMISNTGFEVSVYGNLFGVLEAELRAYSRFGNLLNSEFRVSGRLTLNILKKIEEGVLYVLRKVAEFADRIISAAQEKLREAKKVFDRAIAALRDAEREVRKARSKVADARHKLDGLRRSLDAVCKFRSCRKICIPFICYCGCAVRVWGACVIPCFKWSSCCFRLPDPICVLYNIGCAILRAPVELLILVAKVVLLVVEVILLAAEILLKALQVIVEKAKIIVDVLIAILEALKWTLRVGLKALEYITSFLLTGIIDIREIGFDIAIGLLKHGHISAYMDVSFLRQSPVRLSIKLPLYNPLALVGDLVERIVPGIGGRKKRDFGGKVNKVLWLAKQFKTEGSILPRY